MKKQYKYSKLQIRIRNAVRQKAKDVPKFAEEGNGAIRILAYPLCETADNWFGGLGNFRKKIPDIPDYEVTFAITSGGSRVIRGVWDGREQKCDCYAYSAMKIAHCSRAQDVGVGLVSGLKLNDPDLTYDNGYGAHLGALCAEVSVTSFGKTKDFCGIYVCVSGADSKDDLECAFAALDVIKNFFSYASSSNMKFSVKVPEFPKDEEVEVE